MSAEWRSTPNFNNRIGRRFGCAVIRNTGGECRSDDGSSLQRRKYYGMKKTLTESNLWLTVCCETRCEMAQRKNRAFAYGGSESRRLYLEGKDATVYPALAALVLRASYKVTTDYLLSFPESVGKVVLVTAGGRGSDQSNIRMRANLRFCWNLVWILPETSRVLPVALNKKGANSPIFHSFCRGFCIEIQLKGVTT